eukprot:c49567_g1_i1 orf=16-195(-)
MKLFHSIPTDPLVLSKRKWWSQIFSSYRFLLKFLLFFIFAVCSKSVNCHLSQDCTFALQ